MLVITNDLCATSSADQLSAELGHAASKAR